MIQNELNIRDGRYYNIVESNNTDKKHRGINFIHAFLHKLKQDQIDNGESGKFTINAKYDTDALKQWANDTDFHTIRKILGGELVMFGSVFIYAMPINIAGKLLIMPYFGTVIETRGRHPLYPDSILINNEAYDRTYESFHTNIIGLQKGIGVTRFTKTIDHKGRPRVLMTNGYLKNKEDHAVNKDELNIAERLVELEEGEYMYPPTKTNIYEVGTTIRNTPNALPDWYGISDWLRSTATIVDELPKEWEFIKTSLTRNKNFADNSDNGVDITEKIENGERNITIDGVTAKYGVPEGVFISGSTTVSTLANLFAEFEDRLHKYSKTFRDSTSSGTNKHNAEVTLFNQGASEYLLTKLDQRNRDWTRFFSHVILPWLEIKIDDKKPVKVKINGSEYESLKLDIMRKNAESDKKPIAPPKPNTANKPTPKKDKKEDK